MLYVIVEHFRNNDPVPVYRRFRERGRMVPDGLVYVSSWVDRELSRCFQLMEASDPQLIAKWTANWSDIVDFEIFPVITSNEAFELIEPKL